MIHLDTSFLIRALLAGSLEDQRLQSWLRAEEELGISSVAWTEFLCGPVGVEIVTLAADLLGEPASFLADDAATAARLFNGSGRRRSSLQDCMVAAVSIRLGASLATSNPGDFRRLAKEGLRLVGW